MKNYQEIKQEIIDEMLRNKRSTSISKKLGFNFDKVARWQNGTKQLRWDEFCELCKCTNTPLISALNDIGFYVKNYNETLYIVKHVRNYFQDSSTKEFAQLLHTNLSTTNRFIKGESYPDLEFILRLIDLKVDMLTIFTNSLIRKKDEKTASFIKYPWMPAVANAMRLKEFLDLPAYSSEWIASYLGIASYEVELAVNEFVKLGLIKKEGPHYERATAVQKTPVITATGSTMKEETNNFLKYWSKFIYKKIGLKDPNAVTEAPERDKCIYRVFSCDEDTAIQIDEILWRAEKEIHELLGQNIKEPTDVRVMLLHHFSASIENEKHS